MPQERHDDELCLSCIRLRSLLRWGHGCSCVRSTGHTARPQGTAEPPREPKAKGMAPLPPIPLAHLRVPQERGDLVAVDDIDFEAELGAVMELDQQLVALDAGQPQLPPQPTPEMQGVIVAAAPMPPMPNGAGVPSGTSNPTNRGDAGMATSSSTDVVQHFNIGNDDVRVRGARAESEAQASIKVLEDQLGASGRARARILKALRQCEMQ